MSEIILKASKREPGKNIAKALRRDGNIPGVYYAKNQDPIHFFLPTLSLRPVIYTAEAKMLSLVVEGSAPKKAILKDVTFDPITDKILHIDLLGVSAGEKLNVEIPLHLVGSSIGVREGGVIDHVMHKAHCIVDPTKMPEHIDVDISALGIGASVQISDISAPGVEFTDRPDAVIVTCAAPKVASETADLSTAEPKLVGED
jgi:large subunit ribosomal protein L25